MADIENDGLVDDRVVDELMDRVESEGLELLGPDGVLTGLTSRIMSKALQVEMDDQLGYEKGDPAGRGSGNSRNGFTQKQVLTDAGSVPVEVPRDRNGEFEPMLVPKHQRRLSEFNDVICGLLSRGMSTRDITAQIRDMYGVEISADLVSKITDAVLPEMQEWMSRPLDPVYPIMYLDAIVVKVRTDGRVINRPCYIAMGVTIDGDKDVLGMRLGDGSEGAKFWLAFCTGLKKRGLNDAIICCCDGLTGFSDAIESVWPQAIVQTCVVHLIRNSIKYVTWKDRKIVANDLKPIYKALDEEHAMAELETFAEKWGEKYPAIVDLWERNWERFIPFLEWDDPIRKIIYTTNAIESLNFQLRKVTKTRGSFPTDNSVYKILYLAIQNIGKHRGGKLGTKTQGWKLALNAFSVAYPERIKI